MRAIEIDRAQPGMVLGKTLYTNDGRILLREGTALSDRYLLALRDMKYASIYIADPRLPDVTVRDVIPDTLRNEAVQVLQRSFGELSKKDFNIGVISDMTKRIIDSILANGTLIIEMADLKSHDNYTFSHSVNVCVLGVMLGAKLRMNEQKLKDLALGLMLHDIGKIAVPIEILQKPGRLTEVEFAKQQEHARAGFDMLREQSTIPAPAKIVILQHHEKYDGTGYPKGLRGDDIHINAQIGAIVDVYDALTSDRTYRKRFMPHEALEYLMSHGNTHFSLDIVNAFVGSVAPYPPGTHVKLSTGEIGVVSDVDMTLPIRPQLLLIQDENGKEISRPFPRMDLRRVPSVTIVKVLQN